MAIVKMKKMHLLGLKRDQDEILNTLQGTGAVQVSRVSEVASDDEEQNIPIPLDLSKELSKLEQKLANLKFAIEFLAPYTQERNPLIYGRPKIKRADLRRVLEESNAHFDVVREIYSLDQRMSRLAGEEVRIQHQMELLSPWATLNMPLEELGSTVKTEFAAITVDRKALEEFKSRVEDDDEGLYAEIEVIGESQDDVMLLLIYYRSQGEVVEGLFKEYSVYLQDFSDYTGTPEENIKRFRARLAEIQKEREVIAQETKSLVGNKRPLEILFDYYSIELAKKEAMVNVSDTQKTFFLEGWLPEEAVKKVESRLAKRSESTYVAFVEPQEEDEIPVLLENSKLVTPFEAVTEMFSLPDPRGLDPNPLMAPFYFVFFGMMLSDAGYGIILSLITGFALLKLKLGGMAKKLTELLFLGGISTIVWGALFGGWFGDLIPIKPLWMNPLEDPMAVLVVCFILGLVQIYTAVFISAYKNIREGKILDALMDQGLWLLLISGLIMFALPQTANIAKYFALAGVLGLVLTQGRAQKNPLMKLGSGVLSLYDITGYLSDVLSYSRLLALGIATGVIGVVINTMARMVGVNAIGVVFMVLILVGGHAFNIAINVLGSYVHSSRLQYVEFFGRFYDSGGKAFEPLRAQTTYVDIEDI